MTDLPRQRFVLDTSAFVTDRIRREGEDLEDGARRLLELIARAKVELGFTCYMPPTIESELTTIFEGEGVDDELFEQLDLWVVTRSPDRHNVQLPAAAVHEFVDEVEDRVNRGLRVAEDAVREAGEATGETIEGEEHITDVDEIVSNLRRKYRDALRKGVLDSHEDFDLIVLAVELDACVVTEDTGLIASARDFGLQYRRGHSFPTMVEEYLRRTGSEFTEGGYTESN